MQVARVTSKGQITLPKSLREELRIAKGDLLGFVIAGNKAQILRLGSVDDFYGSIRVRGRQDFQKIRNATKRRMAGAIASEGE